MSPIDWLKGLAGILGVAVLLGVALVSPVHGLTVLAVVGLVAWAVRASKKSGDK